MTETADRPLVTFALFAYNQEQYIREAIEGAFAQTYEPLEIILSDDCSTDRTFEIMQEMAAAYEGPHEVRVRRNRQNLGLAAHLNAVVEIAGGEILVLAAGDDISLPDRTEASFECLRRNPAVTAVLLSANVINEAGRTVGERLSGKSKVGGGLQTLSDLLAWRHTTFGATRAVRRDVLTRFGPLNATCPTEDTPLLLRSLLCGPNALSHHKAVLYRRHENNLSGLASLRRMNTDEIYSQHRSDINLAVQMELIPHRMATKLEKWITLDHEIRRLRLKIASEEVKNFKDTMLAVQHPATSLREKAKLLATYFASLSDAHK
ncbi:hypothetical protein DRV85_15975 [Rhodosalinus halophilus]|uniref:Glycosyltransferase 2-like domain-containing protein n=1 Tax=Rhodosalinus halophilus TaxID=2259333 RepID=A0A365U4U6_9RHOB|nr:glycosyltransferase family A protein [Rhodosalinus halophilus]RBI83310.1 hypothetical protein DRV85_15975 [Rhodosalinus halophilus]